MTPPLRIALVGAGMMGANHARVIAESPEAELAAVCDVNIGAARALAERYRSRAYSDLDALLAGEKIDGAIVATTTSEHLRVASILIGAGAHVLIEKPIADSVESARTLIAAAAAAGITLAVGHIERFNPAVLALKHRLSRGELGKLFEISTQRKGPFPPRVLDVGVVIDLAVHDLDAVLFISDSVPVRVYAEVDRRIHTSHEDQLHGLMRLANGIIASMSINWLSPTKVRDLTVTGERGMFRVDYLTQDLYQYENAAADTTEYEALAVLRGVKEGRMIRHVVNKVEPLRAEFDAFVAAIRGDRSKIVTGEDGLAALQLAHALLRSGASGAPVALA
ncbi:MAG TPA: Gfo/Idh/MocA family oxidoreductase [Thermoflexales bacterium]|nr:Gfo/Idh/MocA family oxidoreductase [Thermoflexales bacterium]